LGVLAVTAVLTVLKVWNAPPGEQGAIAYKETGAFAVGVPASVVGAFLGELTGTALGGPVGTVIGGIVGSIIGGAIGGLAGDKLGERFWDWLIGPEEIRPNAEQVDCDCGNVPFGGIVGVLKRVECNTRQQSLRRLASEGKLTLRNGDGGLSGAGDNFCDPNASGPASWPNPGGSPSPPNK
jgi:hypothetical protein